MPSLTEIGRALANAVGLETPGQQQENWNKRVQHMQDFLVTLSEGGIAGVEAEEEFLEQLVRTMQVRSG